MQEATRMALSWAHTSAKVADVAKVLMLNKSMVTLSFHVKYVSASPNGTLTYANDNPYVM